MPVFENSFIRLDANLITRATPYGQLGELGLKRYLHILKYTDNEWGSSVSGNKSFNSKVAYIYPKGFKQIDKNLCSMGYISQERVAQKLIRTVPNNVPFYDISTGNLYAHNVHPISNRAMGRSRLDYILLPQTALSHALLMPLSKMLLYLKLYRYNSYEVFRGIDVNVLHYNGTEFYINPRVGFDAQLSEQEVCILLAELIEEGLLESEPLIVKSVDYGMFHRLITCSSIPDGEHQIITQLVPKFQFRKGDEDNENE
jgi:hypothetical protein